MDKDRQTDRQTQRGRRDTDSQRSTKERDENVHAAVKSDLLAHRDLSVRTTWEDAGREVFWREMRDKQE